MDRYYLAYGSNLCHEQMQFRCKDNHVVGSTILENYRLVFKGRENGYSYLTVEECEGSYVPIGVYKISKSDEKSLDRYEGYPESYQKEYVSVMLDGKMITGLIYVMNKKFDYHIPTCEYINVCKRGYKNFNFNPSILDNAYEISVASVCNGYRKMLNYKK